MSDHTHRDDRLTIGCPACIEHVQADQRRAERQETAHEQEFELAIEISVAPIMERMWLNAPNDLTAEEATELLQDNDILYDIDLWELATATVVSVKPAKPQNNTTSAKCATLKS